MLLYTHKLFFDLSGADSTEFDSSSELTDDCCSSDDGGRSGDGATSRPIQMVMPSLGDFRGCQQRAVSGSNFRVIC